MRSWKMWLAILLLFVVGFTAGTFSGRFVLYHLGIRTNMTMRDMKNRRIDFLRDKLKLNDKQYAEVMRIGNEGIDRIEAIRRSLHPQIDSIVDEIEAQIAEVLTEEQRAKFERFRAEDKMRRQQFFKRFKGNRPPPPPMFGLPMGGPMPPPPPPPMHD